MAASTPRISCLPDALHTAHTARIVHERGQKHETAGGCESLAILQPAAGPVLTDHQPMRRYYAVEGIRAQS